MTREPWMDEPNTPEELADLRRLKEKLKAATDRLARTTGAERDAAMRSLTFMLREQTGQLERSNALRRARWEQRRASPENPEGGAE